ncbi:hypothetical protein I6A81_17900 [Frankia sp. CN7]|uniref:DUF6603 domain-containing protein n=2 Tax=Frankia nepalensis TaxID=1836974 RepID=A0A937RBK6_9ACTN|nr:DUF6603 domain-containing protein [Frankia nepalensis]MBL7498084.1 hypothetical protein [Frankia nepalensis]MBL7629076.1 hypothetical protein [Frankia nepalensis]
MTVRVDELRDLLSAADGDGRPAGVDGTVELPRDLVGSDGLAEVLRRVCPPGPGDGRFLPLEPLAGDPDGLWISGRLTGEMGGPVPVRVAFERDGRDGTAVAGARVTIGPAGWRLTVRELAGLVGADCPDLPGGLAELTGLTLDHHELTGTRIAAGTGPDGRVAVVVVPDDVPRKAGTARGKRKSTAGSGSLPGGALRMVVAEGAGGSGWQVLSASRPVPAAEGARLAARLAEIGDAPVPAALGAGLVGAGDWLVLSGAGAPVVVPLRRRGPAGAAGGAARGQWPPAVGGRRAGRAPRRPGPVAMLSARDGGFVVVVPPRTRAGRLTVTAMPAPARLPAGRGWTDPGVPAGGQGVSINYENPPLRVAGALSPFPTTDPDYAATVAGVVMVDIGVLNGTAMGAYVVEKLGGSPSFFGFGSLGRDKGIGPLAFQVRGIAAGMGWNSAIRVPQATSVADFPFLVALDNPGEIGADEEGLSDPMEVLRVLTGGAHPWVRPSRGDLWVAAGLAFSCFETIFGRAMLLVQAGNDLTIALIGIGGTEFPRHGDKKYARLELAVELVLRPVAGELSLGAALTPNSYVFDDDCAIHGGVGLKVWFGAHPQAGDFALSMGGYHPSYDVPVGYPKNERLGITWGLGSKVTVVGGGYFAITPSAVMAGGRLEVKFHSGALRAWLTAYADALVQWDPFRFDIAIGVSVGVSATIKVWFVRISITVEIGADLRVWGPPTGGEAKVSLWFVSFTIGFGADRDRMPPPLAWNEFARMLPPPDAAVRVVPVSGLVADGYDEDGRRGGAQAPWQVSESGFTFSTDSAVPVSGIYLDTAQTPAVRGDRLDIRPMQQEDLASSHRVTLTRDAQAGDLSRWSVTETRASVPQAMWGTGRGEVLPQPGEQLVHDQLTGAHYTSPPVDYGTSTGYMSEQALAFDPLPDDGPMPLDPDARPGPAPVHEDGTIALIVAGVDAPERRAARTQLAAALTGFGLDLGDLDAELPGYARAAATAFTAEPMLVPA